MNFMFISNAGCLKQRRPAFLLYRKGCPVK